MSVVLRCTVFVCCAVALAGCNRASKPKECAEPREYHSQRDMPPLEVPADLDGPDPSGIVKIPDIAGQEGEYPQRDECLEGPPDFFDTSPV